VYYITLRNFICCLLFCVHLLAPQKPSLDGFLDLCVEQVVLKYGKKEKTGHALQRDQLQEEEKTEAQNLEKGFGYIGYKVEGDSSLFIA